MLHQISLEQSLILNFFGGYVYFIFENREQKQSFINFIQLYDERFAQGFERIDEMASAIWKPSKTTHRSQVEFSTDKTYFQTYDALPIDYSLVMKYADRFYSTYTKLINKEDEILMSKILGGGGSDTYSCARKPRRESR